MKDADQSAGKLITFLMVAAVIIICLPTGAKEPDGPRNPEASLQLLKEGNARFVGGAVSHPKQDKARRLWTEEQGQFPKALVLTCSDSRVPVETLFDQGIGDIFVVRVEGNVPNAAVLGTIEYAVEYLNVPLILVMGHTHCGAVDSIWVSGELPGNLDTLLAPLKGVALRVRYSLPMSTDDAKAKEEVIKANVKNTAAIILEDAEGVAKRIRSGDLTILQAVYDIGSGEVVWLPDTISILMNDSADSLLWPMKNKKD